MRIDWATCRALRRLVVLRVGQADGKGWQIPHPDASREHRHQQARIETAAQKRTDWHVADEVQAQRFLDACLELVDQFVVRPCDFGS